MTLRKQLFAVKSVDLLMAEMAGEHRLRRVLGPVSLTSLGVGAIIGAGIFVLTGLAANVYAGPALVLSFVVAGLFLHRFPGPCGDMAVGQLDVKPLARRNLPHRAHAVALGIPDQRKTAAEDALVAERSEQLGAAVQMAPVPAESVEDAPPQAGLKHRGAFGAARDPVGEHLGGEARTDPFQPHPLARRHRGQRGRGLAPQAGEADTGPVERGCDCYACITFSRAYLRHLFHAEELLGYRLATIHNLRFMGRFMNALRSAIAADRLNEFKIEFLARFRSKRVA